MPDPTDPATSYPTCANETHSGNPWPKENVMSPTNPPPASDATHTPGECWCETCRPNTMLQSRMILCPVCGNKRCPRTTHHDNACTGSNEPGQRGSSWENYPTPGAGGAGDELAPCDYRSMYESAVNAVSNLIAERDALRAAVEKIIDGTQYPDWGASGDALRELQGVWDEAQGELADIAKVALARGPAAGETTDGGGED
jgi:hypothetical protein